MVPATTKSAAVHGKRAIRGIVSKPTGAAHPINGDGFEAPIVRTEHSSRGAWVAPSIVWGIGIGLIIAAADAVTIILAGRFDPTQWPIDDIDTLINVALYTLIAVAIYFLP